MLFTHERWFKNYSILQALLTTDDDLYDSLDVFIARDNFASSESRHEGTMIRTPPQSAY